MWPLLGDPGAAQSSLWLIIGLPLLGAAINGLIGRRLGKANVALIAVTALVVAFLLSVVAFSCVANGEVLHFQGGTWFRVGGGGDRALLDVSWGFLFDRLSGTLALVVTGVGALIHVYSVSYMEHEDEAGYARYFAYLNLFVAAMMTLVLGDGLVLTFLGWEGVGLCSYLLIGFWFTDRQKAYCGRKAFVVNRIGDFGFLLGAFSLIALFGTTDYGQLAAAARSASPGLLLTSGAFAGHTLGGALEFTTLMFFLGCAGKSAQLPLYVWLPDAMAGPTPVSALIHAATMVTAGVYLIARTSALFALAPASSATVMLIGAVTAVLAAAIALAQNDIKKVLAYSTVSQLGFMFIGVGAGVYWAGVLHLVTHAFFKACLFLGAGAVMHGLRDDTDLRNMGGLWGRMPNTAKTFLVATLAITGVLPLSGFFSKDAILVGAFHDVNSAAPWAGRVAYALGTLAAAGTAFYMTRLFALIFAGEGRSEAARQARDASPTMTVPLWILAALSVVALLLGLPQLAALGAWGEVFGRFIAPVFAQADSVDAHAAHVALWPFAVAWGVAVGSAAVAWRMYAGAWRGAPGHVARGCPRLYQFTCDKFRVDELYDVLVVRRVRELAYALWRGVDTWLVDGAVNLVAWLTAALGRAFRRVQNGDAQRYAALMALAVAVILWSVLGGGFSCNR